MLDDTQRIFRVSPSPKLPDDLSEKVDQLVNALECCVAGHQTSVGQGPWAVDGVWDAETVEGFERSTKQRWGMEYSLDTNVIRLWGDPSSLHKVLIENLHALLIARLGTAISDLDFDEGVKEALVNDVLVSELPPPKYTLKHPHSKSEITTKHPDAAVAVHQDYSHCPQQQKSPGIVLEVAYLNEGLRTLDSEIRLWAQNIAGAPARIALGVHIKDRPGYPADPYATLVVRLPEEDNLFLVPFGAGSSVGLISGKQVGCSVADALTGRDLPGYSGFPDEQCEVQDKCPLIPIGNVYLDMSKELFEKKHQVVIPDEKMKALTGLTIAPDLMKLRLAVFRSLYTPSEKSLGKRLSCGYRFKE